jgi:hypothetical protein
LASLIMVGLVATNYKIMKYSTSKTLATNL